MFSFVIIFKYISFKNYNTFVLKPFGRFQEEEITSLVSLATCYPPSTPEGVRFVTISLCIMICCNTLLASQENEAKCVQWLKRLAGSESPFFGK